MIDGKKIEEAKRAFIKDRDALGVVAKNDLACGFKAGAAWALQEFKKSLWHDASEEPKHDKQITYIWWNDITKTIVLNEEADRYNNTPSQIWHNVCKNYKVTRWCYVDDILPKEGGK